jgi:alpha-glucosidase
MPGRSLLSVALTLTILVGPLMVTAAGKKPPAPSDKIAKRLKALDRFYKQHIVAHGLLIVSSQKVSIRALREAEYLMGKMLANRPDVMKKVTDRGIRICVMGYSEMTTDMPETKGMSPWWDMRARGLGGNPLMCAEENLLNFKGDPWGGENIFVHEFGHIIQGAIAQLDGITKGSFEALFEKAKKTGRFRGYGMNNSGEFWAEGVQAYFDCNGKKRGFFAGGQSSLEALGPDGKHLCHIQTREQLKRYLPEFAKLLDRSFKHNKWRYVPVAKRLDQPHLRGYDPKKAPVFRWPKKVVENFIRLDAEKKAAEAKKAQRQKKRK